MKTTPAFTKAFFFSVSAGWLAAMLFLAWDAKAASVSPAGYTNGFGTQPSAADWATLSIAGGSGDTYSTDTEVNATIRASTVVMQTVLDEGNPPSATGNATWSESGLYLQTRPTGNRFTALLGKFVNNTGTNATQIRLSYLLTIAAGGVAEESGKGLRVYYSLNGGVTGWINLAALNTVVAVNGSSVVNTNFSLNWTNGGSLSLLWVDDNSSGSGTDAANQLDNLSLQVTAGSMPPFLCTVTTPAHNAALRSDTAITAMAFAAYGTSPYVLEYFTNSGAGNTVFASAGVSGTAPYSLNLGALPPGTYNIYAVATDHGSDPAITNSATNSFSVVNPISFALTSPPDGATFEHTTAVAGAATVSGGTAPYVVQFYLDEVPMGAAVTSLPYQRDLGALFVGDHTISASVMDAKGWVSNSLVSIVHITGPLAVRLTPTNGTLIGHETAFSLKAQVGGGTAPYAASFYINGQLAGSATSPPFTLNVGILPAGSYTCHVQVTDSSLPTAQQASSETNVINIARPPVRVMPLGDSITYGLPVPGGYRAPLYQLFTNSGREVDFIGTQTGNGAASLPDSNHEGYSGITIDGVNSILPAIFSASIGPDFILLLLGVNDYRGGGEISDATNRLEALVVRLAINWPSAKIIVANLLPVAEPLNTQIQTTFNPLLPGLCERQRALGRQVYFNDLRSSVTLADLPDQLHPNQFGYNKMATNWFAAMQALCTDCPPWFSLQPTNQAMLPGTNVSLVAKADSVFGALQYQWRFNGTEIPNATNATYSFTNASLAHQGNYSVAATDANGTTISSSALLYYYVRPVFVLNPVPQTVLQGGTATFTAMATGAPPIWYRWMSNSFYITTNNTGVFVITNVQSSFRIRALATNLASGPFGVVMTPSTGATLTMLPDHDADGMADEWEAQYGFDTNSVEDALFDFDGDGLSNRAEYVAGTIPSDASSLLKLTLSPPGAGVLEFVAQANIAYTVQYRTNLTLAPWIDFTNFGAQSEARTVQVHAVNPPPTWERYYRIVTPPIP
jgi:lysophospholipase L1-like esterase